MKNAWRRDAFLLLGLTGLSVGLALEYSPGWAAIVVSTILITFGLAPWKGDAN